MAELEVIFSENPDTQDIIIENGFHTQASKNECMRQLGKIVYDYLEHNYLPNTIKHSSINDPNEFYNIQQLELYGRRIFQTDCIDSLARVFKIGHEGNFKLDRRLIIASLKLASYIGHLAQCQNIFQFSSIVNFVKSYGEIKRISIRHLNKTEPDGMTNKFSKMVNDFEEIYDIINNEQQTREVYKFSTVLSGVHHFFKHGYNEDDKILENNNELDDNDFADLLTTFRRMSLEDSVKNYYNKMTNFFKANISNYVSKRPIWGGTGIVREYRNKNNFGVLIFREGKPTVVTYWGEGITKKTPRPKRPTYFLPETPIVFDKDNNPMKRLLIADYTLNQYFGDTFGETSVVTSVSQLNFSDLKQTLKAYFRSVKKELKKKNYMLEEIDKERDEGAVESKKVVNSFIFSFSSFLLFWVVNF